MYILGVRGCMVQDVDKQLMCTLFYWHYLFFSSDWLDDDGAESFCCWDLHCIWSHRIIDESQLCKLVRHCPSQQPKIFSHLHFANYFTYYKYLFPSTTYALYQGSIQYIWIWISTWKSDVQLLQMMSIVSKFELTFVKTLHIRDQTCNRLIMGLSP